MNSNRIDLETKVLAEIVIFAALSAILYTIRPFSLPYGGSITLGSMVPVMWLSLRRSIHVGFTAGTIFGLLALLIDIMLLPYSPITNPVQVIIEYPIAFGILGLAGVFQKTSIYTSIIGVGISVLAKFLLHFLCGIFFWAYTVPQGWNPIAWAAVYNGSFLIAEFIISAILMFLLVKKRTLEYRI